MALYCQTLQLYFMQFKSLQIIPDLYVICVIILVNTLYRLIFSFINWRVFEKEGILLCPTLTQTYELWFEWLNVKGEGLKGEACRVWLWVKQRGMKGPLEKGRWH